MFRYTPPPIVSARVMFAPTGSVLLPAFYDTASSSTSPAQLDQSYFPNSGARRRSLPPRTYDHYYIYSSVIITIFSAFFMITHIVIITNNYCLLIYYYCTFSQYNEITPSRGGTLAHRWRGVRSTQCLTTRIVLYCHTYVRNSIIQSRINNIFTTFSFEFKFL